MKYGEFMKKASICFKFVASLLLLIFICSLLLADLLKVKQSDAASLGLPEPTSMLSLSADYQLPLLKGIRLDPENPLNLKFIIDTADKGQVNPEETQRLVSYFLAALTVPEEDLWVNLSPYESDRISTKSLGETDMGKDLLAQDYILKQLSSSLTNPETKLGKEYWSKIVGAQSRRAGRDVSHAAPKDLFNKIWIIPEKADIYEKDNFAFITESSLDVKTEQDYLATKIYNNPVNSVNPVKNNALINNIKTDINTGKNFAQVRQIYNSLILALWFKQKVADSFYKHYLNSNKTNGIELDDKKVKEKIWKLYCQSFKKGVYNLIKSDGKKKRSYFSGGFDGSRAARTMARANVSASSLNHYARGPLVETNIVLSAASALTHGDDLNSNSSSSSIELNELFKEMKARVLHPEYFVESAGQYSAKEFLSELFNEVKLNDNISNKLDPLEMLKNIVIEFPAEGVPDDAHVFMKEVLSAAFRHEAKHAFYDMELYPMLEDNEDWDEILDESYRFEFDELVRKYRLINDYYTEFYKVLDIVISENFGKAKGHVWSSLIFKWKSIMEELDVVKSELFELMTLYRHISDNVSSDEYKMFEMGLSSIDTLLADLQSVSADLKNLNTDRKVNVTEILNAKIKINDTVKFNVQANKGLNVLSHPLKLGFVFENLISNASYALKERAKQEGKNYSGQIDVSIKKVDQNVVLKFTDNGIGMSEDVLAKNWLFEEGNTTKGDKGTGVGMSLVKRILDDMNATIKVESELGKGTTFTIKFPTASSALEQREVGGIDLQGINLNVSSSGLPVDIKNINPETFNGFTFKIMSMKKIEQVEETLLAYAG